MIPSSLCPKPVMNSCAQALVRSFSDPRLERTERRHLRRWSTCGTRSIRDLVFRKVQVLLFVSVCFIQTPSVNHLPHTRQAVRKVLRRDKSAFPDISHTPLTKFSHSPPSELSVGARMGTTDQCKRILHVCWSSFLPHRRREGAFHP